MSLNRFRKGNHVLIGSARFLILKKLDGNRWQLENEVTGEWCVVREHDLLDRFANNELVFAKNEATDGNATGDRALASYSPHLIAAAQIRVQYLKEIDRHQPIVFTTKALESLTSAVAERIGDANSPSWRTLSRDYRRWLAAGATFGPSSSAMPTAVAVARKCFRKSGQLAMR
jgi:hypothetical protein